MLLPNPRAASFSVVFLASALAVTLLFLVGSGSPPPRLGPASDATTPPLASLAALPLDFVENRGQWSASTRFVARKGTLVATLEDDAVRLDLGGAGRRSLAFSFEGASPAAKVVGERKRAGRYNFFSGNDPARWRANVPAHASVLYRGIYDGVDVRVREGRERLEYDVLVAPRADLDQVVIRPDGASSLGIGPDGGMLLRTRGGTLRQAPPVAWEVLPGGKRRPIESRFRLLDAGRFGFVAARRNPALPLVIDPGLEWATFLGGSGDESIQGLELAPDGTGDVIVAGQTWSPDFPHTSGHHTPVGGTPYVARLNASGNALVYSTFFGGSGNNPVWGMAVDAAGRPIVVGGTTSPDFPTTPGAYDRTGGHELGGNYDAFVIKFNETGSAVVFGTYLGGSPDTGPEEAMRVDLDPAGSVVVAGYTHSPDFPTTAGAYDRTVSGKDVFVSRLDPTGSNLTYSTVLGGDGIDEVFDIAVDPAGVVNLTGKISQFFDQPGLFPTTPDAFDATFDGGGSTPATDGYLARLKLDGAGAADLKYSTYLGGAQYKEAGTAVAVDPANPELVTVGGWTYSGDFPTTPGALLRTHFAPIDTSMAFVSRFRFPAAGGGSLAWSTFYGAPGGQSTNDIVIDDAGRPLVVGAIGADDPPTTERAFDRIPGIGHHLGVADGFAARISADGSRLEYSTLLGGGGNDDTAQHVAYAGGTSIVTGGLTDSPDFPVTPGAFDRVYGHDGRHTDRGNSPGGIADDAFVARLDLQTPAGGDTTPPPAPELRGPPTGATYTAHALAVTFDWHDVPDASGIEAYHIQISKDPGFVNDIRVGFSSWHEAWVPTSVEVRDFNISQTGTFSWRVQALDKAGNLGPWSAVRTVTVNSPTPAAAPVLVSPPNGSRFAPGTVTLDWNPAARANFYELQVDTRSNFSNPNRIWVRGLTQTRHTLSFTTEGTRWWRVKGTNDSLTDGPWSTVWSFEVKRGAGPAPVPPPEPPPSGGSPTGTATAVTSISPEELSIYGGQTAQRTVNLNGKAPPGGAVVALASNYPERASVPPSVVVPEGMTSAPFTITAPGGKDLVRQAFITAEYGGAPAQGIITTVFPDDPINELQALAVGNASVGFGTGTTATESAVGGATLQGRVGLTTGWVAGPGGAEVKLASTNPALVSVPPAVTIPAGANTTTFAVATQPVDTVTKVVVRAARSMDFRLTVELLPPDALQSLALNPATVTGGNPSQGTVNLSSPAPAGGRVVSLSSSDTTVATVPASVTVPAGAASATFTVTTKVVSGEGRWSIISASAGGITRTQTINVNPPPPGPTLSALTVNPTSVTGGNSSTGTVTLSGTVSACCAIVTLASGNAAVATVPASVTVPVGSSSAQFTVTTSSVTASTSVTISGERGTQRSAVLTVNPAGVSPPPPPPPPPPTADTVAIQLAEFSSGRLRIEATSTSSSATLRAYVSSTDALIGTLSNDGGGRYRGEFSWPSNPGSVTVKSSLGGTATRTVTVK
jgi:hypothetical protein